MKIRAYMLCRDHRLRRRTLGLDDSSFIFAGGRYMVAGVEDGELMNRRSDFYEPCLIYLQSSSAPLKTVRSVKYVAERVWWKRTHEGLSGVSEFKFPKWIKKLADPKVAVWLTIGLVLLYSLITGGGVL